MNVVYAQCHYTVRRLDIKREDSSLVAEDKQGPSYVMEREKQVKIEDNNGWRKCEDVEEGASRSAIEWFQCGRGMCPVYSDQ